MRWIIAGLGIVVGLIALAVGALFVIPSERIARIATGEFHALTGWTMFIDGDVSPSLWPTLGVTISDVSVDNAAWSEKGPMFRADRVSVGVEWQGLWGGDIRVRDVVVEGAEIVLQTSPDGVSNWALGREPSGASTAAGSSNTLPNITLERATVAGSTLRIIAADGSERRLSDLAATLTMPDLSGPLEANLSATANGAPLEANVALEALASLLTTGETLASVAVSAGSTQIDLDGVLGVNPTSFDGVLVADLGNLSGVAPVLGIAPPELPRGLGQDQITANGQLVFVGDTITLRNARLAADQNTMAGEISVILGGERPRLEGRLSSPSLDFSEMGGDREEASGATGPSGWSKDPIDLSGLGAIDADVTVSADSLRIGNSALGRTSLTTTIDNARAVTQINELYAYDGQVAGAFVVNARQGLSMRADLSGSAIAISRLFSELFEYDRLISLGDMTISVLTSGDSQHALINGMNGDGTFNFGAGELLGWDLAGMLETLSLDTFRSGKNTIFDSVTGTFRIVDGVVINDDMQFTAPLLEARGRGELGLGGQTLNYRITPKLTTGKNAGLSVPLIVTGSWDAPKFRLDLEALVQQEFKEEADAAKAKAKEKLEKELKGAQDKLKRDLEEKAVEGILKLLR